MEPLYTFYMPNGDILVKSVEEAVEFVQGAACELNEGEYIRAVLQRVDSEDYIEVIIEPVK